MQVVMTVVVVLQLSNGHNVTSIGTFIKSNIHLLSTGTRMRHATTSAIDAAVICTKGDSLFPRLLLIVSYVKKNRAAVGALPTAAGANPR